MNMLFHFLQENISSFERKVLYENYFLEHDFLKSTESENDKSVDQSSYRERKTRKEYERMETSIDTETIRPRDIPFLLANPHPVLKEGARGKEVTLLKATLLFLKYPVDTTQMNTFTQKDVLSLQEFQYNNSLVTDGVVGNAIWKALQTAVEKKTGKTVEKIPIGTHVGDGIVIGDGTNAWRENPIKPELPPTQDPRQSFRLVNRDRSDLSFQNAYKRRLEELTQELVSLKREYRSVGGDRSRRMEIMDKILRGEKELEQIKKALDDMKRER